jgi:hypothetical protein
MRRFTTTGILFCLMAVLFPCLPTAAAASFAGDGAAESPAPGGILLSSGYRHIREQGIDTSVGKIVKGDRTVVRYDIGPLAGLHVDPNHPEHCGRFEKEDIEGQTMLLCVTGFNFTMVFVESAANCYGTAQDDKELSTLLLMLKTYRGAHRVPTVRLRH